MYLNNFILRKLWQSMVSSHTGRQDNWPKPEDLISLNAAAKLSGLSASHLRLLVRQKELWGIKVGRDWFTTKEAVREYLSRDHKPGPKSSKTEAWPKLTRLTIIIASDYNSAASYRLQLFQSLRQMLSRRPSQTSERRQSWAVELIPRSKRVTGVASLSLLFITTPT